jgi:hypothetical protein
MAKKQSRKILRMRMPSAFDGSSVVVDEAKVAE